MEIIEQAGFTEAEIKKFTSLMRYKLLQHKDRGASWKTCPFEQLAQHLVEEFSEYFLCKEPIKAREELADIANMCLMLFLRIEMDI